MKIFSVLVVIGTALTLAAPIVAEELSQEDHVNASTEAMDYTISDLATQDAEMVLELSPSPINDYAIQNDADDPWEVDQGLTLKELLQLWSDRAGYTLVWEANINYTIGVDITVHGTFRDAVKQVLQHYWYRDVPLQGIVYRNRVLRIREWHS